MWTQSVLLPSRYKVARTTSKKAGSNGKKELFGTEGCKLENQTCSFPAALFSSNVRTKVCFVHLSNGSYGARFFQILGYRQNIVSRQYINVIMNTFILNYLYKTCIKIQDYTCWVQKRNVYFTYVPLLDEGVTILSDKKYIKMKMLFPRFSVKIA